MISFLQGRHEVRIPEFLLFSSSDTSRVGGLVGVEAYTIDANDPHTACLMPTRAKPKLFYIYITHSAAHRSNGGRRVTNHVRLAVRPRLLNQRGRERKGGTVIFLPEPLLFFFIPPEV